MRALATRLTTLLLLSTSSLTFAQSASLKGLFRESGTQEPVGQVKIVLTRFADSSDVKRVTSKDDGTFEITGLGVFRYRLEATRLGYLPLRMVIPVTKAGQDLGVLAMTAESVNIPGVTVNESPAPAAQKADTTEFRAGALKTHRDATAEELVQKLPGVTVENGQVTAQGEQVRQVLVNGRPFFGSDPTAAMRNLPAEVVDRIQVYDRASDQAEFSGFDDGQSQRTMNFILRNQNVRFGKLYGGYGDQERYQAGGNATWIKGAQRLTLLGLSNNINQTNFSPQDLFGALSGSGAGGGTGGGPRMMMFGGGRGGPGGPGGHRMRMGGTGGFDPSSFFVGQQAGLSTTHSGGLNYVNEWGTRFKASASVFVNDAASDNDQALGREYVPPQDSILTYDQISRGRTDNRNQRFDTRLEWNPDTLLSIVLQPRLYFQQNDVRTSESAQNLSEPGSVLSAARNESFTRTTGDNLSSRLTIRRRFAKRGRNVTAETNAGRNKRDAAADQLSLTDYYEGATVTSDTLDQRTRTLTATNSFSTRIAFTEPLTPSVQAQLYYNPSLTWSDSDARALRFDALTGTYSLPDSATSNTYENRTNSQSVGASLLVTKGPWKWLSSAAYQRLRLHSEQTYPSSRTLEESFGDVLPSMTLTGNLPDQRSIRIAWTTSTNAPTISQLQNVLNNSNPLSLSTGNPSLEPTYTNALSLRFSKADPSRSRSRFMFFNLSRTADPIANSTFTAPADTTIDGVFLARGTQLTRPVNLDESWSSNLFGVYSRPLTWMKSNLSFNGGGTFSRTPTLIQNQTNVSSTYGIRSGAVLASNISPNLDFTVSYQGTYNISRSTLSTSSTGDYYTHTAALRFNATMGPGVVVRQELTHNLQSGVREGYGQDVLLWNSTVGKKFLKDGRGELRLTATDMLEQDRSVSRTVTETYVQDSRDLTLGRYVQAVLTYTFR